MRIGIEVAAELLDRWRDWLAPEVQPFFVESLDARPWVLTPEVRDTYKVWRIDRAREVRWLDEATFLGLDRADRARLVRSQVACRRGAVPTVRAWADLIDVATLREQADGHRFVWWPSLLGDDAIAAEILRRIIAEHRLPASRHEEVPRRVWEGCAERLPGVRRLAGTFPSGSGPNCFGSVLAAAGVEGADREWVVVEPFVEWLEVHTRPGGGGDDEPGTVLLWRDREGQPVHAAVTIGGGWAFEKPSQEWSTPRTVLRVDELIRANRTSGQRIERHRLRGG